MKNILFLLLILVILIPTIVVGQAGRYSDIALTNLNGYAKIASGATIKVCTSTGVFAVCNTPTATIYTNAAASVVSANPFTSDNNGNFGFWAVPGWYNVTISGTGLTAYTLQAYVPILLSTDNVFTGNDTFSGPVTTFNGTSVVFPPPVWTIRNPFVATYSLGVAPVGGSHYIPIQYTTTWTGNVSGNSDVIAVDFDSTCGGSNNMNFCMGGRFNIAYTGSGTLADRLVGYASESTHNGTGSLAFMYGHQVRLAITNTGGIAGPSGFMSNYVAEVPAWTGSGTSPILYGFLFKDPGNASTVPGHVTNNIIGFNCPEITMTIPNLAACYFSGISADTNKWNLYIDGTAANWIRGVTGFGNLPTAGDQVDVGGILRTEGVQLNSLGTYGKMIFNASNGFTANARRFLITNAVTGNTFAIIRSVDSATDPALNATTGAITSGTADITISNAGLVGHPNGITIGGGTTIALYKKAVDAPGAITITAATCTDRGVTIAGSTVDATISIAANYALEANLSLSPGQAVAGTAHYRICNPTIGDITLSAGSTFNISIVQ